ncbi:MAG: endonuclease/exonuclease/phosphatase family protein [Flavobacteriales bacterium]
MLKKRILFVVLVLFSIPILFFGGLLLQGTLTKFHPEAFMTIENQGLAKERIVPDTFSILIWNIGYCGLGKEMDFFNDGGKSVRASQAQTEQYKQAIIDFLKKKSELVDFLLIQEVDRNSKRSYYNDQHQDLLEALPGFAGAFALNYHVRFVPVPFGFPYTPYGKTYAGLSNFSRFQPESALRVQYPGSFSWPTSLYMLNRCALEQIFELQNGEKLMIVNTHNTAYDQTGEIKRVEMEFMRKRYDSLAAEGFHIIIGGDWNQIPPGFDATAFNQDIAPGYTPHAIDEQLIPKAWQVAFDPRFPTNRSNATPYIKGKSYTTLIDFFMVSPSFEVLKVETIPLDFEHSDHEPVLLQVAFTPD